jgi:chorismate dehydratase
VIRIGVVSFTNTLPLARGLERRLPEARIVPATPARIAMGLESGGLDIGLVPVATLADNPQWPVVPGLGIAARGPVRSVLLLSRTAPSRIERLVGDPASRTSNLLARAWLRHRHDVAPEVLPGPESAVERLPLGDATVAIGDQALFWDRPVEHVIDLGGAWTEWTGLPFVFAVWAGPGADTPGLREALAATYEENAERLDELAREASPEDPARRDLIESYLRHSIRYRLGPEENEGLRRFLRLGAALGYFGAAAERVFHVHGA